MSANNDLFAVRTNHKGSVFRIFLSVFLIILFSTDAFAESHGINIKLVFPFGEGGSVCSPSYRTLDGCCEPPKSIYSYNPTVKGCCAQPNSISTVGANTRCCVPWKAPQLRWGQTESSPCGGYCPPTSNHLTYSGYSSCCSACSEVIAFQSAPLNVCGTCCSRIPESCGSAGYRVCESTTGSAYCSSDINKCIPSTDWIAGTSGEGGYSCCAPCAGQRYGQTTTDCGSCCGAGQERVVYGADASCCPVCTKSRYGQTATSVCGVCCDSNKQRYMNGFAANVPTYTAETLCPADQCAVELSGQHISGNPAGKICCPPGVDPYFNGATPSWDLAGKLSFNFITVGCMPEGYSIGNFGENAYGYGIQIKMTAGCPIGQEMAMYWIQTSMYAQDKPARAVNWAGYQGGYCCPIGYKAKQLAPYSGMNIGTACCLPGQSASYTYFYNGNLYITPACVDP